MSSGQKWAPVRPEYYVQVGGMHENPFGVPRDEIVRFILENPAEVVAQVVFGRYVESSGLVFGSEIVQQMFDRSLERVTGNYWIDRAAADAARRARYRFGTMGCPYFTGVDFARQTDYTVLITLDISVKPARVVYFKRLNRVPWEEIYTEVGKAAALWGPNILCDSTGPGGDVSMDALESRWFCPKHARTILIGNQCLDRNGRANDCKAHDYIALSCCEGFHFGASSKKELVEHLRNTMAVGYNPLAPEQPFGWIRSPQIAQLEEEIAFYAWDDKKLQTDCLFALALAAWHGLEDPVEDPLYGSVYGS